MRIRRATLEDAKELSALRKATIRAINKDDYTPAQIARWSKRWNTVEFQRKDDPFLRYVAVQDGKIVGYADIRKKSPEEMGGLYVRKDFLQKGVGRKLMKKIEDVVRKMGIKRFLLHSSTTAKGFYEKLGYKVLSFKKNRIKGDYYILEKKL